MRCANVLIDIQRISISCFIQGVWRCLLMIWFRGTPFYAHVEACPFRENMGEGFEMGTAREYAIHQVLHEEISDGHVWLTDNKDIVWKGRNENEKSRIVVMIKRTDRLFCPVVYCDALFCNRDYVRRRNKRWCENIGQKNCCGHKESCPQACKENYKSKNCEGPFNASLGKDKQDEKDSIMLSAYYRDKLKIAGDQKTVELKIKECGFIGRIRACFDHPQVVVRVAAWMGVVSAILGFAGLMVGLLGAIFGGVSICQSIAISIGGHSTDGASSWIGYVIHGALGILVFISLVLCGWFVKKCFSLIEELKDQHL